MATSSVQQLVAGIRRQFAAAGANTATAKAGAPRKATGTTPRASPSVAGPAATAVAAEPAIEQIIKRRVGQIGRDDPKRQKKAFRVFLEAVLLDELGEHLQHDPRFHHLLDEVQDAMENHPATRRLIDQASQSLLSN